MKAVIAIFFLFMLSAPLLGRFSGIEPKEIENRSLAPMPQFVARDLLKPGYVERTWGGFLKDSLPFRDIALHGKALISIRL